MSAWTRSDGEVPWWFIVLQHLDDDSDSDDSDYIDTRSSTSSDIESEPDDDPESIDIEHTDRKKYFTWDKQKFPEPIAMQQSLAARGHKMVTIVDPHISSSRGYHVHDIASKEGFYIKKKNGNEDFDGWCWPGKSHYLDFTSSKVRNFWAEQFAFDKYDGSTESL